MMKIKGEKKMKLFFVFWKVFHVRDFLSFTLLGIFWGFSLHYKVCLGVSTNVGQFIHFNNSKLPTLVEQFQGT